MPRTDWVRGFIKRHRLTKRLTDNVQAARAEVTREVLMDYFNNLGKWVNVSADRIYNYNKTNVTDNPGAKTVICSNRTLYYMFTRCRLLTGDQAGCMNRP